VRPADIAIVRSDEPPGAAMLSSEVLVVEPSERTLVVTLSADGIEFKLKTPVGDGIRPGDQMQVRFDSTKFYVFDPATGLALRQTAAAAEVEVDDGIGAQ
jgi:ABC-type sugar transport system ATPase subunit